MNLQGYKLPQYITLIKDPKKLNYDRFGRLKKTFKNNR